MAPRLAQLDRHLCHVESMWRMQKVDCFQLPSDRRCTHLPQTFLEFVDEDPSDVISGQGQHLPRCSSSPVLAAPVELPSENDDAAANAAAAAFNLEEEPPASPTCPASAPEDEKAQAGEEQAGPKSQGTKSQQAASDRLPEKRRRREMRKKCGWVRARGVVTLQMLGVHPRLGVDKLVETLDGCGLAGCYNYVHIPRDISSGLGRGFAFINLRTVEWAIHAVEQLDGLPLPAQENGPGAVTFCAAKHQGYASCLNKMRKYSRVHNPILHPYATTEDGITVLMAPPEMDKSESSDGTSSMSTAADDGIDTWTTPQDMPASK